MWYNIDVTRTNELKEVTQMAVNLVDEMAKDGRTLTKETLEGILKVYNKLNKSVKAVNKSTSTQDKLTHLYNTTKKDKFWSEVYELSDGFNLFFDWFPEEFPKAGLDEINLWVSNEYSEELQLDNEMEVSITDKNGFTYEVTVTIEDVRYTLKKLKV